MSTAYMIKIKYESHLKEIIVKIEIILSAKIPSDYGHHASESKECAGHHVILILFRFSKEKRSF